MEMGPVCLIFYSDGKEWASYVRGELEQLEMDIHLIDFEAEQPTASAASLAYLQQASVIILIMTPQLINTLLDNEQMTFHDLNPEPSKTIILLLGETKQTFHEVSISNRFPKFEQHKWTLLEYKDDWKSIELEITRIYDPTPPLPPSPAIVSPRSDPRPKKEKSDKLKPEKNEMTVTPSRGRCEERTEIVLAFKNEITQHTIDVFLENQVEHSEVMHIKEVTKLNPYTFKFTAPEHQPCKMHIKAMVKSRDTTRMRCEAAVEYEYYSDMDALDGVNHILLYILNATFDVLQGNRIETDQLDRRVAMGLFDYDNSNIGTKAFELLFGQYEYCDTESSLEDTPTLLHLAAKYGLKELVAKLTDLPGAAFANSIQNSEKQHPGEMASKHGHTDVHEMLNHFTELEHMHYGVYVEMAGYGNPTDVPNYIRKYYNAIAHTNKHEIEPVDYVDRDDYIQMTGLPKQTPMDQHRTQSESDSAATSQQDEYYSCVESEHAQRPQLPARTGDFIAEPESKPSPEKNPQANMSNQHQELISIMTEFKNKQIDMNQVQDYFTVWHKDHKKTNKVKNTSFRRAKVELEKEKENVKKNKGGILKKIFGGGRTEIKQRDGTKNYTKGVDNPYVEQQARGNPTQSRDSTASNSSNGSRGSTASVDSGTISDGQPASCPRSDYTSNQRRNRQSATELSLVKEMSLPPPVPPRAAAQQHDRRPAVVPRVR